MADSNLRVLHIYEHDGRVFEDRVNDALRKIISEGGEVGDIKYVSDAATVQKQGGFGALIIYETEAP